MRNFSRACIVAALMALGLVVHPGSASAGGGACSYYQPTSFSARAYCSAINGTQHRVAIRCYVPALGARNVYSAWTYGNWTATVYCPTYQGVPGGIIDRAIQTR